jgi:hypothetical protein
VKLIGIDLSTHPRDCGVCMLENNAVTYIGHGSSINEHPDFAWLLASGSVAC